MVDNDDVIPDRASGAFAFPTELSWDQIKESVNNSRRMRLLAAYTTGTIIYNGTTTVTWSQDIVIIFLSPTTDVVYTNTITAGNIATSGDGHILWCRLTNADTNIAMLSTAKASFTRASGLSNESGNVFILGVTDATDFHIIDFTRSNPTFTNIINLGLTASQIVETDGSKQLISAAKASGYNKTLGTGSGQVAEGNHSHGSSQLFAWYSYANSTSANFVFSGGSGNEIQTAYDANANEGWKKVSSFTVPVTNNSAPTRFTLAHRINGGSWIQCDTIPNLNGGPENLTCSHNTIQSVVVGDILEFRVETTSGNWTAGSETQATIYEGYVVT